MLRFLFPRLTPAERRGQPLFDSAVAEARQPHWFLEGGVPDTLDGRFAVLATVCALLSVRLESTGESGEAQSAALTERFIEAMDAEHRQMGMSDPTLGKTVRKMVGGLARRVGAWRAAVGGEMNWDDAVRSSLLGDGSGTGFEHVSEELRGLWQRLGSAPDDAVSMGKFDAR